MVPLDSTDTISYFSLGDLREVLHGGLRMARRRNVAENFSWLSRVHEHYRREDIQTTERRICDSKDPIVTLSRSGNNRSKFRQICSQCE